MIMKLLKGLKLKGKCLFFFEERGKENHGKVLLDEFVAMMIAKEIGDLVARDLLVP